MFSKIPREAQVQRGTCDLHKANRSREASTGQDRTGSARVQGRSEPGRRGLALTARWGDVRRGGQFKGRRAPPGLGVGHCSAVS